MHKYADLLVHGRKCSWCVLTRTTKPSFTDVSSSSDSCLELSTYTASKLCDYVFSTSKFRVTIKPCDCQALPIRIDF